MPADGGGRMMAPRSAAAILSEVTEAKKGVRGSIYQGFDRSGDYPEKIPGKAEGQEWKIFK